MKLKKDPHVTPAATDDPFGGDPFAGEPVSTTPSTTAIAASKPKSGGWLRIVKGNRALTVVGGIALLSLGFGLGASNLFVNEADATLDVAPEPGLITVPISVGSLNNDVTIRADIGFADATDISLNTTGVVTGAIPEPGQEIDALSVALEVTGRPVIVLPGDLPAFRTLSIGMSGPDVVQFKEAMRAVGINAGDPSNDVFDATAANAVRVLYERVGYPVPVGSGTGQADGDAVTAAELALNNARRELPRLLEDLDLAIQGLERSQQAAETAVRSWDHALQAAQAEWDRQNAAYQTALDEWNAKNDAFNACGEETTTQPPSIDEFIASLSVCIEPGERPTAPGSRPTHPGGAYGSRDSLQIALDDANRTLARARADRPVQEADLRRNITDLERGLADAREGALPQLPDSEVLFLNNLPRRVDSVSVQRGATLSGSPMRVSGAVLELRGSATEANARLLEVGGEAFFDMPGGGQHRAVIAEINAPTDGGSRWNIEFVPDPLTAEEFTSLQRSPNVRVVIPVGATQGAVLYVPVSALTAGPGGEARIEVVSGDPRDGANATTRIVVVETGLSANGFVEVTPVGDTLAEGDLVVVGR